MSLDLAKLQKVKQRNGKTIAQCPACAEAGGDGEGNHLAIFPDGRFACVTHQGEHEHRRRIHELAGDRGEGRKTGPQASTPPQESGADIYWPACCAAMLRNTAAQERVANWRGWTPEFVRVCAKAGVIGLHDGMVAFPVSADGERVTGAHCFGWPGTSSAKAWFVHGGKNYPLIIGADTLVGVREVHLAESQWDCLSLLFAKGWNGGPLPAPFVCTRGTSIHADLTEDLAGVEIVWLWPQRDEVKVEGRPPPSEEWVERGLALFPESVTVVRRVDVPDDFKDWNDVVRARGPVETLAAIKTAVGAAAVVPVPKSAKSAESPAGTNSADIADFDIEDDSESGEAAESDSAFPLDALPEVMRRMVEEAARVSLAPEMLAACCALSTVSAALGGGLEVDSSGGRRVRGNVYLLVVATSGTGKGRTFEIVTKAFSNVALDAVFEWREKTVARARAEIIEAEARKKRLGELLGKSPTGEERERLLDELADAERDLDAARLKAVEPTWITADCTREALEKLLAVAPGESIASLSPEARGVVDVLCGRYTDGKSDESIYLSGYSGEACVVHRKNSQPVTMKRPCISVLWMLQPDKFRDMLANPALAESGMMQRFLVAVSAAEPVEEPESWPVIDPTVLERWNVLVRDLATAFHSNGADPRCVESPPEVKAIFRDYYNGFIPMRRSGGEYQDISSYAARWQENAWRLALVLHAAIHGVAAVGHPMNTQTAHAAIRLMEWFRGQQLRMLAVGREERQRARLEKLKVALETYPNHQTTVRELDRRHGFSRDEIITLAKAFPALLAVEPVRTGRAGRPPEVVRWLIT